MASCELVGEPSIDAGAWASAPDGRTHAILFETNGGATTSYGYEVKLHTADHKTPDVLAARLYDAGRSDCAYGVNLRWRGPTTIALEFPSAKDVQVSPSAIVGGRRIDVAAQAGINDDAAPCGGMVAS